MSRCIVLLVSLVSFLVFLLCHLIFITACMSHADSIRAPVAVADRLTFFLCVLFSEPKPKARHPEEETAKNQD